MEDQKDYQKPSKASKREVKQDEAKESCPANLATGIADAVKNEDNLNALTVKKELRVLELRTSEKDLRALTEDLRKEFRARDLVGYRILFCLPSGRKVYSTL